MKPIYAHFLDRELAESVGKSLNPILIENITATILLLTDSDLFCSLSTLFETCSKIPEHFHRMVHLVSNGKLNAISHHPSIREFLETRVALYEHDAMRYPMYFQVSDEIISNTEKTNIVYKNSSTTAELRKHLRSVADGDNEFMCSQNTEQQEILTENRSALHFGLDYIEERAITWAAFSDYTKTKTSEFSIRKEISAKYTSHYMRFIGGDIVTGIPGINYYDHLSSSFPLIDFWLLSRIFSFLLPKRSCGSFLADSFVVSLINTEREQMHSSLSQKIRILIRALNLQAKSNGHNNFVDIRNHILTKITEIFRSFGPVTVVNNAYNWLFEANNYLDRVLTFLSDSSRDAKQTVDFAKKLEKGIMTKVLICVATDLEIKTMAEFFGSRKMQLKTMYDGNLVYFKCSENVDLELCAVKSQIGSSSAGGSCLTTEEAIRKLQPNFVIAIGIAFGIDSKKQAIGDILVSSQVQCYELQRVGETTIIPRGDKVPAHPGLISRCDAAKIAWKKANIHTGLILSGDKLVDSAVFKKSLIELEPESIGGDMEAAGILAACIRHNTPWLIIKGICDWGENKGDGDQGHACINAFDLFFHILDAKGWETFY